MIDCESCGKTGPFCNAEYQARRAAWVSSHCATCSGCGFGDSPDFCMIVEREQKTISTDCADPETP